MRGFCSWQARGNTKHQSRHRRAQQIVAYASHCNKAACGTLLIWTASSNSNIVLAGGQPPREAAKRQSRYGTAQQSVTSYDIACCSVKQHIAVCSWLASKGQQEAAEQALRRLRGPDQIEADLAEMQAAAEEESKARSWALLRSPAVRGELQVGQTLRPVVVFILVCHALVVRPVAVSIVVCHALEVRPFVSPLWCAMHLWPSVF